MPSVSPFPSPRVALAAALALAASTLWPDSTVAQNPIDWLFGPRHSVPFEGSPNIAVRASERGKGTLGMAGPNRRLLEAKISLARNGRAEIILQGERDAFRFAGTWKRGAANQAHIHITHTYDRSPASGAGTITLAGNSFERLDFKGNAAALKGAYHARFRIAEETVDARTGAKPRFRMDSERRGKGSMGISGPNKRLSQARVILDADGDARVIVSGESSHAFMGAWARRTPNQIDLRFVRGPDRRPMEATGHVLLTSRGQHFDFSKLEILGHSHSLGGRVRVSFEASKREHIKQRQRFRGAQAQIPGRGSIGLRGPNRNLQNGHITLYQNGNATLEFHEDRRRHVLEATWFGCAEAHHLDLEIDRVNGHPAQAQGRVTLQGNRVVGVRCDGQAAAYKGDFRLNYQLETGKRENARRLGRRFAQ